MLPDIQPGNTKILYFFNCLLDGMHTNSFLCCDFLCVRKSVYIDTLFVLSIPYEDRKEQEKFNKFVDKFVKNVL